MEKAKTIAILALMLSVTVFPFQILQQNPVSFTLCVDEKTFCKIWRGYTESISGNITITDVATGKVYWNAPLPPTKKICIKTPHGTTVLIQWKDWRGVQQERHTIKCNGNYDELVNTIPFPKSTQSLFLLIKSRVE